jgi:hypothetical protein
VQWKFNNEVLEDKELYHFEKFEDTHCLEVKDVEKQDAGPYTCVATNSEGQATAEIPLVIQGKRSSTGFSDLCAFLCVRYVKECTSKKDAVAQVFSEELLPFLKSTSSSL